MATGIIRTCAIADVFLLSEGKRNNIQPIMKKLIAVSNAILVPGEIKKLKYHSPVRDDSRLVLIE
jgi:hypothetical protein